MAVFEKFADRLLVGLEGAQFTIVKGDKGGATKYGVILSTWKEYGYDKNHDGDVDVEDLKLITLDDAKRIAKKVFWDFFKADEIKNQSVAELLADWGYNTGRSLVARRIQRILNLPVDGVIGELSLKAINKTNQEKLFDAIKADRKSFIEFLVKTDPSQQKFYKGWMNRVNQFFFLEAAKDILP
jgi:lysozyme family protein